MCYRQLMSVAEAGEIIDDLDKVKANPQQLVAVPLAVLYVLTANSASPDAKYSGTLRMTKLAVDSRYPLPAVQHVPPPMPEDFQLHKDMELANKILEQDYDIFKELAKS